MTTAFAPSPSFCPHVNTSPRAVGWGLITRSEAGCKAGNSSLRCDRPPCRPTKCRQLSSARLTRFHFSGGATTGTFTPLATVSSGPCLHPSHISGPYSCSPTHRKAYRLQHNGPGQPLLAPSYLSSSSSPFLLSTSLAPPARPSTARQLAPSAGPSPSDQAAPSSPAPHPTIRVRYAAPYGRPLAFRPPAAASLRCPILLNCSLHHGHSCGGQAPSAERRSGPHGSRRNVWTAAAPGPDVPHAIAPTQEEAILEADEECSFGELLEQTLPSHPKLVRGRLDNGLRYVILPNSVPPNRLEAHLEMHVGSVDEAEGEQGVAHLIEHVTFLGSKKRERLLGTGARSNAYTDFHHTVFHVHSPVRAQDTGELLLPLVLDALHEIAFMPKFLTSRIEKERRAVLSELQMMNTIEYRVDCKLLQQLHSENLLSCRFPIGREEQILQWDPDTIKAFHDRWYFPANATLFIVGDIGSVKQTTEMIQAQFGTILPGIFYPSRIGAHPGRNPGTWDPLRPLPPASAPLDYDEGSRPVPTLPQPRRKERHIIRPPVQHRWSRPSPNAKSGYDASPNTQVVPHIFQHDLLQQFSLSIFCKSPVRPIRTYHDLRSVFMERIVLSALQFRINTRYKNASPPFTSIELDHSDSGREGCSVTTLTVVAEPRDWEGAVTVAVQEFRRLREFGVTLGELTRYRAALLKDSEQLAAMVDNVPSVDNLDFIMESDALTHAIMDQQQGHHALSAVAGSVILDEVNATARRLLDYVAEYGQPLAPIPAAIVACVPLTIPRANGEEGDEPFFIAPEDIEKCLVKARELPIEAEREVVVPQALAPPWLIAEKLSRNGGPRFVPFMDGTRAGLVKVVDEETGLTQRLLSNGVRINYKHTVNEAKGGVLRLVAAGGRARETEDAPGAVCVGTRALSESGSIGNFTREEVELFCVSHLLNCVLEADEEFTAMDFRFTVRDGGMEAMFQVLHMVLEHSVWQEDALDRAKQLYLSFFRQMPKSLERATAHQLLSTLFHGDRRFMEPTPDALERLTIPTVRKAVFDQLKTWNMEVSVVGDFDEEELERCLLKYLGTVNGSARPEPNDDSLEEEKPIVILPNPDSTVRNQRVLLRDTDERACAYIAGAAPNRWGFTSDGRDLNKASLVPVPVGMNEAEAEPSSLQLSQPLHSELVTQEDGSLWWRRPRHPLYSAVALGLLAEIINARLFTTVRDALGLTYDVSFELSLFDRLRTGWFVISVTSTPAKIEQAVEASLNVLRGLHGNQVTDRELERAQRTLITRHESDLKDNNYWLGLLMHLQAPTVERKDANCIRDLPQLYERCTIEDVYNAYDHLTIDEDSVYTCIGLSGSSAVADAAAGAGTVVISEVDGGNGAVAEEDLVMQEEEMPSAGRRGKSTMTLPTT